MPPPALVFAARTVDWLPHLLYGAGTTTPLPRLGAGSNADLPTPNTKPRLVGAGAAIPTTIRNALAPAIRKVCWQTAAGGVNQLSRQHVAWHALQTSGGSLATDGWLAHRVRRLQVKPMRRPQTTIRDAVTIRPVARCGSMDGSSRLTQNQFRELLQR